MRQKMLPLQIVGIKTDLIRVLHQLHLLGCLHIMDVDEFPFLRVQQLTPEPEMLRLQEEYAYLSIQVDGLLATLERSSAIDDAGVGCECDLKQISDSLTELTSRVQSLTERLTSLKAEQADLPRYTATLQKLLSILPESARNPDNACIGLLISQSHPEVLNFVREKIIDLVGEQVQIVSGEVDENMLAMLVVTPRAHTAEIETLLSQEDISRLRLPPEFDEGPPDKILSDIQRRLKIIPEEIREVRGELGSLADHWVVPLAQWRKFLKDNLDLYDILPLVGETKKTFIIVGWVPAKEYERLETKLGGISQANVVVQKLPLSAEVEKSAPIILTNPPPIRPFEELVNLFSPPSYDGLDPSALMALFLPLFFGMMLGDVGYGLILFVAAWLLSRQQKRGFIGSILRILMIGAAWSILYGLFYGEFFGTLGEYIGMHPLVFDRASPENLLAFLLLTVGVGAAHITLGLILGVWEALCHKSRNHLLERGGMLLGLTALFVIIPCLLGYLPRGFMTPSIAALIVGIVLLGIPLGLPGLLIGPIEFISLIGNILSYMRIAAIGLASVYLAKVANDIAGALGSLVVGLIFAVLIHAINLIMGTFSPTIHSLRLHYVEFFRKFYEGGGRLYRPFRSRFEVHA